MKKIISTFVTIPGILVVCLVFLGLYGLYRRDKLLLINLFLGIILYSISISCIATPLIGIVEKRGIYSGEQGVDVIILLGGGVIDGVEDFSGVSIPSYDMIPRIVDAVRLHNRYNIPILVSGGSVAGSQKEAHVVKRFLIDLGVKPKEIIIEDESRDTVENALYVKKKLFQIGYKRGLLVTSAYHIRRAEYLFKKAGLDVVSHSSAPLSGKGKGCNLYDFLPNINSLSKSARALRESIGIFFYYIKYGLFISSE
ncbi:MAG: YdcF family protein [Spirochaetota bacterium]|nr:YdcF family protein [Spirochaetota bacterium]